MTATTDETGIWLTIREAPLAVKALLVGNFVNKLGWFLQVFLVLFLTSRRASATYRPVLRSASTAAARWSV